MSKILNTTTFISKYKPYFIDDFHIDQDFSSILRTLFEMDDLNMLFIGKTNSGKTTFLYSIIREYYGLGKHDTISESNILFINNLKEQGIQFFRNEMKTFCRSRSNIFGKKKLIIVDDMDTINEQSQQVFRNYIDKYKNNINFIAVCTNIQKIIESIQSRVHILHIPTLTESKIREIMENIIKCENIKIDEESKNYILSISNNSIRNIINNLEKIHILGDDINLQLCRKLCSNISFQQFEEYISALQLHSTLCNETENYPLQNSIKILYKIHDFGYSVIDILDYFFTFVKMTKLLTEEQKYMIIPIICKYITIFHNIHEDSIELALFTNDIQPIIHV